MQQLTPNTLLQGGKYKIERVLGQGSFGVTYLAEHSSLGRKVCIKEFFMKELNTRKEDGSITAMSQGTLSYNYAQKFRKEAMNMACMEHPNIVRVTDSFEENGTYYYVMDYIDGQNLNDYIKQCPMSVDEATTTIKKVAEALIYMHDTMHMLHLDLKPGNVMRRKDGHIFLIDFGLSKHYDANGAPETSTTIGLGTAGYAPIEQANQAKSGEFRPTIDVYALGATYYKLLTGKTPPAASELVSDPELIEDRLREANIPQGVTDVVVNAMMPSVKKRTSNVSEFLSSFTSNRRQSQMPPNVAGHRESIYNSATSNEATLVNNNRNKQTFNTQYNNSNSFDRVSVASSSNDYNNENIKAEQQMETEEPKIEVEDILSKHLLWFPGIGVITAVIGMIMAMIFALFVDGINFDIYDQYYYFISFASIISLSIGGFVAGWLGGKYYLVNDISNAKWFFVLAPLFGVNVIDLIFQDDEPLEMMPQIDFMIGSLLIVILAFCTIAGAKISINKKVCETTYTSFFSSPFSFEGRIRRAEYLYSTIFYYVFYFDTLRSCGHAENSGYSDISSIYLLWMIPLTWFLLAQNTKRCHDLGHSGWWQFIPFYFLLLMFSDSNEGDNEYGENPKGINI